MKNGEFEALSTNNDISTIRGLDDQEIRDAVEELKRSTSAIEKQTEALRLQQNAMATLVKNKRRNDLARAQSDKHQQKKWSIDKRATSAAVSYLIG